MIRSLADIESIESIPLGQRGLPASTYEALSRGASIDPGATALIFFLEGNSYRRSVHYRYADLMEQIHRAANLFHRLGIGARDVVSTLLPNLPEAHFTIWGAQAVGIVNPINPLLEPPQIADLLRAARSKVLVTLAPVPGSDIWDKVEAIRGDVPGLETVLRVDLARYLPPFKRRALRVVDAVRRVGARGRSGTGRHRSSRQRIADFGAELARQPGDRLPTGRVIRPDDPAAYFHTGGTTGLPKLAVHTHSNEVFDAWSASQNLVIGSGRTIFCGLPLFHVNGVMVTGLIPWSNGGTVVVGSPRGYRDRGVIDNFWKIVEHYRINYFSGVPTLYATLLDVPIGDADIRSLEFGVCGAAPMPEGVFRRFEERTGVRILEGYGLTEATCISAVNPPHGQRRVGSIGHRLPYQQMKTVELAADGKRVRDCRPGENGVIVLRGANVFAGYKDEIHESDAWLDSGDEQERWLNTGDLGYVDPDGYFWITGRRKELIIRGGHNIDPLVIEEALHAHPAVAMVAAVPRPDPRVGEVPVAYVTLESGTTTAEGPLLIFLKERISERAAIPHGIRICPELPQTAVGKIFKPALCWREIADVYRGEIASLDGVREVEVDVRPDQDRRTLATARVTAAPDVDPDLLVARVETALGSYSVPCDVHITRR